MSVPVILAVDERSDPGTGMLFRCMCWERVAHRSGRGLSTDALKSAQISVFPMVLGGRMDHGQAQVLSPPGFMKDVTPLVSTPRGLRT